MTGHCLLRAKGSLSSEACGQARKTTCCSAFLASTTASCANYLLRVVPRLTDYLATVCQAPFVGSKTRAARCLGIRSPTYPTLAVFAMISHMLHSIIVRDTSNCMQHLACNESGHVPSSVSKLVYAGDTLTSYIHLTTICELDFAKNHPSPGLTA